MILDDEARRCHYRQVVQLLIASVTDRYTSIRDLNCTVMASQLCIICTYYHDHHKKNLPWQICCQGVTTLPDMLGENESSI